MGKHEEKEGGRQYIRSILTLTVIFNSAPRFAKWAEFLCSPRTYSFQIGYVFSTWFSILHFFFSCNSRTKSPRKDNDAHCCQNFYPQYWLSCHFSFSLDTWTASQPLHPMAKKRCLKFCTALPNVKLYTLTYGTHFKISRLQQTIWWWKLLVIHSPECARLGVTAVKSGCVIFCIYFTKKFSTCRN